MDESTRNFPRSSSVAFRARLIGSVHRDRVPLRHRMRARGRCSHCRIARPADSRAEFHESRVVHTRISRRAPTAPPPPTMPAALDAVSIGMRRFVIRASTRAMFASTIGVGSVEGERCDGAGRIATRHRGGRRSVPKLGGIPRRIFLADALRSAMQVACSRVVSQPLPPARSTSAEARPAASAAISRKSFEPASIIIHDGCYLRLLEHEFADEYCIRVARSTPGKVTPMNPEPIA